MSPATLARAREIVTYTQRTTGGRTFRCSRWTAALLDHTKARLAAEHPGAQLLIIQGCYHTGVAASAGTHDEDACLDVQIVGLEWYDAEKFLRLCGWAAYWRHTGSWASRRSWHIHMVAIPPGLPADPTEYGVLQAFHAIGLQVGRWVPGQIDDYYNDALGLKGQHGRGTDHGYRPDNITALAFDFEAWEAQLQEDDMGAPETIARLTAIRDRAKATAAALEQDEADLDRLIELDARRHTAEKTPLQTAAGQ